MIINTATIHALPKSVSTEMSLKALDSDVLTVPCFKYLNDFLSREQEQKQEYTEKLSFCPAAEFEILETIGSGGEGLVLKCRLPQDSNPVALKLVCKQ